MRGHSCAIPSVPVSVPELKQAVSRLKESEWRELFAYLVHLKHETPQWKRATAKRLGEMKRGKLCLRRN